MNHMAREFEVCDECSWNRLFIQRGKHGFSPKSSSFFKVMLGRNISKVLNVPPKFSRILPSLVGKNTNKVYLEDSTGQEWEVVLSNVQGSLAFQKGWRKFFLDHALEQGDFVVFHYMTGSHFIVKIYGRSGCEKPFPGVESYHNKRPKTTRNSITRKSLFDSLDGERVPSQENNCFNAQAVPRSDTNFIWSQDDVNNVNKSPVVAGNVQSQGKIIEKQVLPEKTVVPEVDLLMEPCFLNDRETGFARENDRERLFDLSVLESPDMKPSLARKGDEDYSFDLSTSKITNKKVEAREDQRKHLFDLPAFDLPDKKPSFPRNCNRDYLSDDSDPSIFKMAGKKVDANLIGKLQENKCSQVSNAIYKAHTGHASFDTKKSLFIQGNTVVPSKKLKSNLSEFGPAPCISPSVDMPLRSTLPLKKVSDFEHLAASSLSQPPGGTMRVVKQEPKEFEQEFFGNALADTSFAANMSFKGECKSDFRDLGLNLIPMEDDVVVVKSEPVDCYDSPSAPGIRITCTVPPDNGSFLELPEALPIKWRQRVILKHKLIFLRNPAGMVWPVIYYNKHGFKILASGWNSFRKANNIHPGDECAFVVEDDYKGIIRVQILNRSEDHQLSRN